MKKRILRAVVVLILIIAPVYNLIAYASQVESIQQENETIDISAFDALSKFNVAEIENEIEKIDDENRRNAILEAQRAERLNNEAKLSEQLKNGTVTYRSLFSDTLIVGDSLMYGLQAYSILDSSNLIAQISASLYHLSDNVEKIINNNPKMLISHYGLNVMSSKSSVNEYISTYLSLLNRIKEALPETEIIVSGIFNVLPKAIKSNSGLSRIAEYNTALKKMCSENGFVYLDNSTLLTGSQSEYYLADGIHLKKDFYVNVWLPKTTVTIGL